MSDTPQAAQVLSDDECLACWTKHTAVADYKTYTLREHVLRALRDVESSILAKLQAAPQAAHGVGDVVAWRYKVPTHDGMGTWTFTKPQPECILEAQPLYAHPATSPAVAVPDEGETVDLIGVKADGSEQALGKAPMPPRMKARDLAREQFGSFVAALETLIDWLVAQGWRYAALATQQAQTAQGDA
jgi:hypothetical protein